MTLGVHRIICTKDCPDRLRLTRGYATFVAREHFENTGHACVVSSLNENDLTPVDEQESSDTAKSIAGQSDRDGAETPGRSSRRVALLAGDIGAE